MLARNKMGLNSEGDGDAERKTEAVYFSTDIHLFFNRNLFIHSGVYKLCLGPCPGSDITQIYASCKFSSVLLCVNSGSRSGPWQVLGRNFSLPLSSIFQDWKSQVDTNRSVWVGDNRGFQHLASPWDHFWLGKLYSMEC